MAGIYVHIPFCRSRCIYCDFFSTTREEQQASFVAALCREMEARQRELPRPRVRTIYIGGGTPSVLAPELLRHILDSIHALYDVEADAEVTVEMNPDDVPRLLPPAQVNRVSLGVQTFDDGLLRLLRRRHDAQGAVAAVKCLQAAGQGNISIDLIYGLPGQTLEMWQRDLDVAFGLGVQHLSAYALSYEAGTLLNRWRAEGRVQEVDEEVQVGMYELLCQRAGEEGFEHYEISNFARPGFASRHNSSYWTGEAYLGFGPGAHSFDGVRTRRANVPDLTEYLRQWTGDKGLGKKEGGGHLFSVEVLTDDELFDEAVMCALRTSRGIPLENIRERFGQARLDSLLRQAAPHLRAGRLARAGGHLRLTPSALMVSDDVMSDLMVC